MDLRQVDTQYTVKGCTDIE
jgi:hypothetical protein